MPPSRRRANVQTIIDESADIVEFIVDGLFAFLADKKYSHRHKRSTPPAYRDKSGVLCALRLVNRELREAIDRRIVAWTLVARDLAIHLREKAVSLAFALREERGRPEREQELARKFASEAADANSAAMLALSNHLQTCLSENLCRCMVFDLSKFQRVVNLQWNLGTFMCLVTERCQVHGSMPGCQCRNVCMGPFGMDNFSELKCGGESFTLYARDKCLDSVCLKPDARFLSHGNDEKVSVNTARAMFRKKGVSHPFSQEGICVATNCWGATSNVTVSSRGVMMLGTAHWPVRILLFRHPAVECKRCSLQEILGLSDKDARTCQEDALRKQEQRAAGEAMMKAKHTSDLCADVDAYMATEKGYPVKSLQELGEVCAGMAESIRAGVLHYSSAPGVTMRNHGLDIEIVRNGLNTTNIFLSSVVDCDRAQGLGLCSAEAYDYVSGMHVGFYGTVQPEWATLYGNLDGYKTVNDLNLGAVCKAMRFFDALEDDSLLAFESRPHDPLPVRWLLSNSQMSIVFDAYFPTKHNFQRSSVETYREICKMDADIRRLISVQESDVELPPLFTKLTHTNGVRGQCSKRASEEVKKWYMDCYALLVKNPSTRCAALDLLGVRPYHLINHALEAGHGGPLPEAGRCSTEYPWRVADSGDDESD